MQELFTTKQIKEIEHQAIEQQFNGDDYILMQQAGLAAFNKIQQLYKNIKHLVIFCGQGNNGGDGFVIAKLAADKFSDVTAVFLGDEHKLTQTSIKAYTEYLACVNNQNIKLVSYKGFIALQPQAGNTTTVYIDALLGIGLNKEPSGEYKQAIDYINNSARQNHVAVFAVDIPSGLQADTGFAYSSTVKAAATITFIGLKRGLLTANGPDHCGELFVDNLNVTPTIFQQIDSESELIDRQWGTALIKDYLPQRAKNSHKHQFGHVVIIGGNKNMPGAVLMAAQAALRAGAGLATIITHSANGAQIIQSQPEIMLYGMNEDVAAHKVHIFDLLNKASVIIVGPGLGQTVWSQDLFTLWLDFVITKPALNNLTTVIDADGLNLLSEVAPDKFKHCSLVLTPHPGEAKKLLHTKFEIGQDRFSAIKLISKNYNAVTVLKGVGSLIYGLQNKLAVCTVGNPGLASAGTGDILTGLIGGLLAQGLDSYHAACLAVYLHGTAADLQAYKYGERGLLATDLLLEIRKLLNN